MARNLFLLVAILAAAMFAALAPAQTLNAPPFFRWANWGVLIANLEFTDSVTRFGERKKADTDSIFVYMRLSVVNAGHEGSSFIPQNMLKIVVGDNAFDAADLDEDGESYVSNIEPTLARIRKCYFELPRSVIKDSFIIRFSQFLGETKDVNISISYPPVPEPTPVPEPIPRTSVDSAITGNQWTPNALIVSGTLTNLSTIPIQITGIDAEGFNQDQTSVARGSDFTIGHNHLAPGEVVKFKVALKDDKKQVKFVKVLPSWSP